MNDFSMAFQSKWRMCINCMGLFFGGHATKGACPSVDDGVLVGPHMTGGIKRSFLVEFDDGITQPNTQSGWRYCWRCEGMFFKDNGTNGVCPAGGEHDPSASGKYRFAGEGQIPSPIDVPSGKVKPFGQWRWCSKCEGMHFVFDRFSAPIPSGPSGDCPKGGKHDPTGSGFYRVKIGPDIAE
jgi:hypothetical protein